MFYILIIDKKMLFSKPFLKLQYDRTKNLPKESEGNIALFNFYYCVQKVSSSKLITETEPTTWSKVTAP